MITFRSEHNNGGVWFSVNDRAVILVSCCAGQNTGSPSVLCVGSGSLRSCPLPISLLCLSRAKEAKKQKKKKKQITPDLRLGFGLQRSLVEFGRNILELLVYYLMLNKCKNLRLGLRLGLGLL